MMKGADTTKLYGFSSEQEAYGTTVWLQLANIFGLTASGFVNFIMKSRFGYAKFEDQVARVKEALHTGTFFQFNVQEIFDASVGDYEARAALEHGFKSEIEGVPVLKLVAINNIENYKNLYAVFGSHKDFKEIFEKVNLEEIKSTSAATSEKEDELGNRTLGKEIENNLIKKRYY